MIKIILKLLSYLRGCGEYFIMAKTIFQINVQYLSLEEVTKVCKETIGFIPVIATGQSKLEFIYEDGKTRCERCGQRTLGNHMIMHYVVCEKCYLDGGPFETYNEAFRYIKNL
jgi:hypothetical protein